MNRRALSTILLCVMVMLLSASCRTGDSVAKIDAEKELDSGVSAGVVWRLVARRDGALVSLLITGKNPSNEARVGPAKPSTLLAVRADIGSASDETIRSVPFIFGWADESVERVRIIPDNGGGEIGIETIQPRGFATSFFIKEIAAAFTAATVEALTSSNKTLARQRLAWQPSLSGAV